MQITILVDNPKSWFIPYAQKIVKQLEKNHQIRLLHDYKEIKEGDCAFFLSCLRIVPKSVLNLSRNNLVIHGSNLPEGRGFSPVSWQILEGKDEIVLTLFESDEAPDSGDIYFKEVVYFQGHELLDEIHRKIGDRIVKMALKFITKYPNIKKKKQKGIPSYYPKRTIKDDELPIDKTIAELFNRFRIANNASHPVYFYYQGHKYILKIYKKDD